VPDLDRLLPISPGDHRVQRDLISGAEGLWRAGVRQLLVRELHLDARALVALLRALAPRARLIVNARCADAERLAARGGFGLHLPGGADVGAVRARFPGTLGYSAHSLADARYARDAGADYVLLSPIWRPTSKAGDRRRTLGLPEAARAQRALDIPVFALGGLTPERARRCRAAGLYGVAAIGALFPDDLPESTEQAARAFLAAQDDARPQLSLL
jgi:thiamine monophosphate synthase